MWQLDVTIVLFIPESFYCVIGNFLFIFFLVGGFSFGPNCLEGNKVVGFDVSEACMLVCSSSRRNTNKYIHQYGTDRLLQESDTKAVRKSGNVARTKSMVVITMYNNWIPLIICMLVCRAHKQWREQFLYIGTGLSYLLFDLITSRNYIWHGYLPWR